MRPSFHTLLATLCFVQSVSAHYRWTSLIRNGVVTPRYKYVRNDTTGINPVQDVASIDIRCNVGGTTSGVHTAIASVVAGSTVGFELDTAIFHPGPLTVYMSQSTVPDLKTYDGSGSWFKIHEVGANIADGKMTWNATGITSYTFTIPPATPPGDYLLRVEHIGLHLANYLDGAQFYISCAQITVTGTGTGTPGPLVKFPGAYSADGPGIFINIWYPVPTNYTVPGPLVWTGR